MDPNLTAFFALGVALAALIRASKTRTVIVTVEQRDCLPPLPAPSLYPVAKKYEVPNVN